MSKFVLVAYHPNDANSDSELNIIHKNKYKKILKAGAEYYKETDATGKVWELYLFIDGIDIAELGPGPFFGFYTEIAALAEAEIDAQNK